MKNKLSDYEPPLPCGRPVRTRHRVNIGTAGAAAGRDLPVAPANNHGASRPAVKSAPALAKFILNFPGDTPKELVAAIAEAMGKPINVIIPDEDAVQTATAQAE